MTFEVETGIRDVCDVGLRTAPYRPGATLEPGDIILAKSGGNVLSDLIARFDGWWTHSAISLGGEQIAHAHADGITRSSLSLFKHSYPGGLAVARPDLDAAVRSEAATWAARITNDSHDVDEAGYKTAYDAGDLGVAFSLLWRAARQPGIEELLALAVDDLESLGPAEAPMLTSTCSGFVFRCYQEGAATTLEIAPAPGIRLEEGHLVVPSRDALLDELRGTATEEESAGLGSGRLKMWRTMLGIATNGVAAAVAASIAKKPVPVAQGVTPMDLWTSPSHGRAAADRWFICGYDEAMAVTADCADQALLKR